MKKMLYDNLRERAKELEKTDSGREFSSFLSDLNELFEWSEAVFEGSRDAIFISDTDSHFISVNRAACALTGYSKEELLQMRIPDIHDDVDLKAYKTYHDRIMGGEEILSIAPIRRKDSSKINTEFNNRRISIGGNYYMHTVARDVTESEKIRIELDLSEKKYKDMIENLKSGYAFHEVVLDSDGKPVDYIFLEVNREFEKLTGLNREEIIGKKVTEVLPGTENDPADWISRYGRVALTGQSEKFENFSENLGKWFRVIAQNFQKGRFLTIIEDITVQKAMQDALINSELLLRQSQRVAGTGSYSYDTRKEFWTTTEEMDNILGIDATFEKSVDNYMNLVHPEDQDKIRSHYYECMKPPVKPLDIEFRIISAKSGLVKWVHAKGELETDDDNNVVKHIGTIQDITIRKNYEKKLDEDSKIRSILLNATEDIIALLNSNGELIEFNDAVVKRLNSTPEELQGKNIFEFFTGKIKKERWTHFKNAVNDRTVKHFSDTRDGRDHDISFYPILDEKNEVQLIAVYSKDVTEKRQAEIALVESEARLQAVFNNAGIGIAVADKYGKLQRVNKYFIEMIGYENEKDVLKLFVGEITHPEDREETRSAFENLTKGRHNLYRTEKRYIRKNGEIIWGDISVSPVIQEKGESGLFIATVVDITETKQAGQLLKESQAQLNSVITSAPIGIGLVADRVFSWTNDMITEICGYTNEELKGKSSRILYPDDEEYNKVGTVKYGMIKEHGTGTVETRWKRKDGKVIDILLSSTPLDPNNWERGVTFTALDITQRKQYEENLRHGEERFRELAETIQEVFWVSSPDWKKIHYISPAFEQIWGIPCDELYKNAKTWFKTVHEEDAGTLDRELKNRISGDFSSKMFTPYRIIRPDGSIRWIQAQAFPIKEDNKIIRVVGVAQDITDRYSAEQDRAKLQEQLFQSQKLESIGRLAGGIAHDFNNTLTSIMGYAELLSMKFPDSDSIVGEAAHIILEGSQRAAHLTRQLLGFARGGKYNPIPININKVIKDTDRLTQLSLSRNIKVTLNLADDIHNIDADINQMNQVLTNLIINAHDAMKDGGELIIESENLLLEHEFGVNYRDFQPGMYVKFSVIDTGPGIPEDQREKVFEPFFTTKAIGQGVGLGLATVYGIVKNHGGYVELFSELGEGSRFSVYLPASKSAPVEHTESRETIKNIGSGKTVLVIDDQEPVRGIIKMQLTELGFSVLLASGGSEALSLLKSHKDQIDIILLDVIMPEMDGLDVYKKIRKKAGDINTLVMSGFSRKGKATEILNKGAHGFIQKPFRINELEKAIAEITD